VSPTPWHLPPIKERKEGKKAGEGEGRRKEKMK
jgi:hypothetical protein